MQAGMRLDEPAWVCAVQLCFSHSPCNRVRLLGKAQPSNKLLADANGHRMLQSPDEHLHVKCNLGGYV